MPARETKFEAHHFYHLYNRRTIFFEPENHLFFLRQLRKCLLPRLDVIAYCLIPTHYHLLARCKPSKTSEVSETSEVLSAEISKAMMKLSVSYTKAINKRFERVGNLFQGAFRAKHIQSDTHLLHLCRYIHGNPVKDGLVATPADWPYSNYLEWIGQRDGTLFDAEFVRQYFNHPADYRAFVLDDLHRRDLPEDIKPYLDEY